MEKITLKELNNKYKEFLEYSITNNKNRFGWYSAILKNGAVCIGNTYAELEQSILSRIEK